MRSLIDDTLKQLSDLPTGTVFTPHDNPDRVLIKYLAYSVYPATFQDGKWIPCGKAEGFDFHQVVRVIYDPDSPKKDYTVYA